MSLWDRAGNRPVEPDVTSTGMNTFPGSLFESPVAPVPVAARPPRRFVAISTFCALAAGGTAGAYLLATTVLADRMADPPAAVPKLPAVAVAPAGEFAPPAPEATRSPAENTGMGPRRHIVRAPAPATQAPAPSSEHPREETTRDDAGTPAEASPWPESSDCDCMPPPVPTPTEPAPPAPPVSSPSAAPPPADDPAPSNHPSIIETDISGM